jgi:N6-L-threonylcarbamoyladenine synthase
MVGLTAGKTLALVAKKPFVAVNHLEAHALTARMTDNIEFPYLLLLVSGGHTQLVAVRGVNDYLRLGSTVDDAIGEAFDKVAKMLGLPYPGGPQVEKCAMEGDPSRFALPRPMQGRPVPDFSLSGLKTAVRLAAEKVAPLNRVDVNDLCASFQAAIVDVIEDRCRAGLRAFREKAGYPTALVVAGGVAANGEIRHGLSRFATGAGVNAPPVTYRAGGRQFVAVAAGGHALFNFPLGDAVIAFALPAREPASALTMTFGVASSMRVARLTEANPPNTTEWIAPMRTQASIANTASGIIGM